MSIHVSSRVWDECRQSGDRLLLMLALADFCNDEGECWPSQITLAKRARCTERGIQKMIDGLINAGELVLLRPGGGRGNSAKYKLPGYTKGERETPNDIRGMRNGDSQNTKRANLSAIKGEQAVPPNHQGEPSLEPSLPASLDAPGFRAAWGEWIQHRKEGKHKLTPLAIKKQLAELEKMGAGEAIKAINHSIARGYRGIFSPNGSSNPVSAKGPGMVENLKCPVIEVY